MLAAEEAMEIDPSENNKMELNHFVQSDFMAQV
jgi:hypothetical protein